MKIVYDVENQNFVENRPIGFVGCMSFARLARLLVSVGEIQPFEKLTHIEISDEGITYRTETKEKAGN